MSAYDRVKRKRRAETRKANSDFITMKHELWMKQLGRGTTKSEREENMRETRRKIQMEKMRLKQFGEIEGCLKQMDRVKQLDRLFKVGSNSLQNNAKKMKQMQLLKKLKQA